jgi:hypothetical protein
MQRLSWPKWPAIFFAKMDGFRPDMPLNHQLSPNAENPAAGSQKNGQLFHINGRNKNTVPKSNGVYSV